MFLGFSGNEDLSDISPLSTAFSPLTSLVEFTIYLGY